jgi:hypothetical protein
MLHAVALFLSLLYHLSSSALRQAVPIANGPPKGGIAKAASTTRAPRTGILLQPYKALRVMTAALCV